MGVGTWSSLRMWEGLSLQEEEGDPILRVVEEGNEVQPEKRVRERLVKKAAALNLLSHDVISLK